MERHGRAQRGSTRFVQRARDGRSAFIQSARGDRWHEAADGQRPQRDPQKHRQDACSEPGSFDHVPFDGGARGRIWYDWYGNTAEGFAKENERVSELVREAGREASDVLRTATVRVVLADGRRDRPHSHDVAALSGSPETIAGGLARFAAAGLQEAILVVSPITERTIRQLGHTVAALKS